MSLIRKKQDEISIDGVSSQKVEMLGRRLVQVITDARASWDTFTDEEKAQLFAWGEKLGMKLAQKAGREMLMGDAQSAIQTVLRTLAEQNSKNLNVFMTELMKGFNT